MSKKKLPPGIKPRGNRWRIDTFYKGYRIRESCATPEMAESLYIGVNTVRSHVKNIYSKLGVHKRSEAVAKAKDLGFI